jgi:hypothetical protein
MVCTPEPYGRTAPLKVRAEILPSKEVQALIARSSCRAHDTELTVNIASVVAEENGRTRRSVQRVIFDFRPAHATSLVVLGCCSFQLAVVRGQQYGRSSDAPRRPATRGW